MEDLGVARMLDLLPIGEGITCSVRRQCER